MIIIDIQFPPCDVRADVRADHCGDLTGPQERIVADLIGKVQDLCDRELEFYRALLAQECEKAEHARRHAEL